MGNVARARLLAAAASVVLTLPAPALAARAEIVDDRDRGNSPFLRYSAARGELNRLSFSVDYFPSTFRSVYRFRDEGAVIQPGPGCRSVNASEVTCEDRLGLSVFAARMAMGDRNDTVVLLPSRLGQTGIDFDVRAGAGDDVVTGGLGANRHTSRFFGDAGNDLLVGGDDDDALSGGGGRDTMRGGGGSDVLSDNDRSGAANADSFDGGAGVDHVSYLRRRRPVFVDLSDRRRDGERREGDLLRNVEEATGGDGNDVLTGTARADTLDGSRGSDAVNGGGGNDFLVGGAGGDTVRSGPGNDFIDAVDVRGLAGRHGADRAFCGPGRDSVLTDQADGPARDCELVSFREGVHTSSAGDGMPPRPSGPSGSGRVSFRAPCPSVSGAPCTLRLTLVTPPSRRSRSIRLGATQVRSAPGSTATLTVRLSRAGLDLLRRHRTLAVHVVVARKWLAVADPEDRFAFDGEVRDQARYTIALAAARGTRPGGR